MEKQYFKDVWLPLSDSFYRMAYSMLGSEADARDAVQDLYIRLWNIRSHLGNVESPMAYGARVIRNICIDRLRARSVHGRDEDAELLAESAVPGAEDSAMVNASIITFERSIPKFSAAFIILSAIFSLSSALSGIPLSSMVRPITAAPYFFTRGKIVFSELSEPLTLFTIATPS